MNNFVEAIQSLQAASIQQDKTLKGIRYEMDGHLMMKLHRNQLKPIEAMINERGIVEKRLVDNADRIEMHQFEQVISSKAGDFAKLF